MEDGNQEKSPQVCQLGEAIDAAKYVSGISTLLVATIQEAKDRISQVEYIFCKQLYPNFQKSSKSLQKIASEAKKAADDNALLEFRLTDLHRLYGQVHEECDVLKADKLKLLVRIDELEEKLLFKTKEFDDGMELHGKLLHTIESKDSILANKEKQVKEREESINALTKELQEKSDELTKEKKFNQELLLKISSNAQTMVNVEMEKNQFRTELGNVTAKVDELRDELRRKSAELEEGNRLRAQLVRQVNTNDLELAKKDQQSSALEGEKKLLLSRISDLENKVKVFEENLKSGVGSISEVSNKNKSCDDLLQQIELKNEELTAERQKRNIAIASYKKLKSQYNFLLTKVPLNKEETFLHVKVEEESDPSNHDAAPEINDETPAGILDAGELIKEKREINSKETLDDEKSDRLNQSKSSPFSSNSKIPTTADWICNRKPASSSGTKRSASRWRDTRSHQSPGGHDPHDDFLDTPYENIRGNLHKVKKDLVQPEIPAQVSNDGSDDETQDMQAESSSKKQQLHAPMPVPKGFKYVEPVRKKSERENLNGVECKQCKKFYDAVHADGDEEVDEKNLRCEHHDGVSRHRYRYVPPMTPEGFWNIGFDTEM